MQVYLKDRKALAFFYREANPQFWDEHWQMESLRDHILSCTSDGFFVPVVKKYLPLGSTVLEGGCGRAHLVHALAHQGYKAIGVDIARETVRKINEAVPDLDVRFGDVRSLPIESSELDGYLSLGVIEHYWEGYRGILAEMRRTVKNGGFLFVSFPQISALRHLKVKTRMYSVSSSQELEDHRGSFYQFAFNWRQVSQDFQSFGFDLIEKRQFDGIKGLKDEIAFLKPFLQPIYDGKKCRRIRIYLDTILRKFTSHCYLLVMQKSES